MIGSSKNSKGGMWLLSVSTLAIFASSVALADDAGVSAPSQAAPGAAIPGAAIPAALASGAAPSGGIPYGSWMLYPSLFAGAVLDDNVYRTRSNRTSAAGVRLSPAFEADLDTGVHKTTIYGNLDTKIFPGYNASLGETATTISGRGGFAHAWSPTSDLVVRASADFTRQDGPFGSALLTGSQNGTATSFVGAPVALNVNGFRQFTDTTTANLSVEKTFTEQTFLRVGAGVQQLIYERPPVGVATAQSGNDYNGFVRGGFWVTPQVNAFVEVGGDLRRYDGNGLYDANGYRVVGGLSTDMVRLFKGEIYGGYQVQYSVFDVFAPQSAPTFGAKVTYYPTQYLNIAASFDDSFGSVAPVTVGYVSTRVMQARLQADYSLYEFWKASVRGGYARTTYINSPTLAQAWLGGAGLSYSFWRNYAMTLDYQYTRSESNGVGALTYSDNTVTAGVTYHY